MVSGREYHLFSYCNAPDQKHALKGDIPSIIVHLTFLFNFNCVFLHLINLSLTLLTYVIIQIPFHSSLRLRSGVVLRKRLGHKTHMLTLDVIEYLPILKNTTISIE